MLLIQIQEERQVNPNICNYDKEIVLENDSFLSLCSTEILLFSVCTVSYSFQFPIIVIYCVSNKILIFYLIWFYIYFDSEPSL